MTQLRALDLTGRCVVDLTQIAALTRLERLELAHNAVVDLGALVTLKRLRYLGLADNPYQAPWGTIRREPFPELTELTELVLDGTPIDNILPLAQAKKLRALSLRRVQTLGTLQSLAALRNLRSLHIDDMVVSDLTALADMTELEELSADGTLVSSVEPLRPLVERYHLRKVSMRGTCVRSCDDLCGASHDCSQPKPESDCFVPEVAFTLYGNQLAVPLPMVERFAPNDLPIWSSDQLARGFEAARSATDIDWKNAASNCDLRASLTERLLRANGFPEVTQVVSFGNLRMLSSDAPFGFYWFDFHIAVAVRAQVGDEPAFFVIDPTLDSARPMALADWFARQIDSSGSSLDFACQPYTAVHSIGSCTDVVDSEGNFRVDRLSLLRGALCPDTSCVPHF
ncbi:MAG TPA: protein-glutamine glutaminase family protein [Polyangia bacterium]